MGMSQQRKNQPHRTPITLKRTTLKLEDGTPCVWEAIQPTEYKQGVTLYCIV